MSQLARDSSETEEAAVSDIEPQNPKTHGSAASTWTHRAATARASSCTPLMTPEARSASAPKSATAPAATTIRMSPAQLFIA